MSLVDDIRQAWGWIGLMPVAIVRENDFGNLIIQDEAGRYWRLCPESCRCWVIAANRGELEALWRDETFLRDWTMAPLVALAQGQCGPLVEGRKYGLKVPDVLGGTYHCDNLCTVPLIELVSFSGHIARQIEGLPDGTSICLQIVK